MDAQNKENKNLYELGIVIRADLDEETFRAEVDRVKALIERFNGTIEKMDDWGRRKLAYPIMKQTEGMYSFFTISSDGDMPREVESRLRIAENVLRFMMIRKDEMDSPAKAAKPAPVAAEPVAEATAEAPADEAAEPQDVAAE